MNWRRRYRHPWPLAIVVVGLLATIRCSLISQLTSPSGVSVQSFSASPSSITTGSFTTLSWNVQGADSVAIDNGIGTVPSQGTRTIQLIWTTTFTLTAKSSATTTQSTVQVPVLPATTPSPIPTPVPSPSPSASPSPGASPTPTPSPSAQSCGNQAGWSGSCSVRLSYPTTPPNGGCVQVNVIQATPDCPASGGTVRTLTLGVTTGTSYSSLVWRAGSESADVLSPPSGTLPGSGNTTLSIQDTVGDSVMKFEIVDPQGNILLRLTLSNL
jgi:hypothetical protein